jgi:LmbE family N-acetylglucosaminyl deacetylase
MFRAIAAPFARVTLVFALTLAASPLVADPRPRPPADAAAIRLALDRMNVIGSALYVAAHPDDENTAFLSWLQSGKGVRTGYLSMTRGDGGQNLIGTETGALLGVIRTQELLAARRVDGAEQYFTRALDFGFSKNPEETLKLWGHDRILADVVWVIRKFQPDVIVTRFLPDSTAGHGHHTASAMLAEEAFDAAADPKRFPEQLQGGVTPWRAKRLAWNVYRFGAQGPDDTPGRVRIDLGDYSPVLGRAYSEIAGESRSMHKTQGFGAAERRGELTNTFETRRGERATADLFDGVDLTWGRVPGGAKVGATLARARRELDPAQPHLLVPLLLQARREMAALPSTPIVVAKRAELDELIRSCAGLWLEAIAQTPTGTPGTRIRVALTAINRSPIEATLERVDVTPADVKAQIDQPLPYNRPVTDTLRVALGAAMPVTQPYWLEADAEPGAFVVSDPRRIGAAENPPALTARFTVRLAGGSITWDVPVVYRWVDRVLGERYRDFLVAPPVTLKFDEKAYLFADRSARPVRVTVSGGDAAVSGALRLTLPSGWSASPASAEITLASAAAETTVRFLVTPAGDRAATAIGAELETGGRRYDRSTVRIDYPHIPLEVLFPRASARAVRADLAFAAARVGYLAGSGDDVPAALRQMGAQVTMLSDEDVQAGDLDRYQAIVAGVRAYNTRPRLRALEPALLEYVNRGGRLVVQYNTSEDGLGEKLGPYPFTISRDRVTVEDAPVDRKDPEHALLTQPNRIDARDFDGWVQERGLYFAQPFDRRYEPVLSSHDPGEPPRDGGLLFARYGRGVFIYTGYAWFRQLPAGVPGAWRLFANLVSAAPPRP